MDNKNNSNPIRDDADHAALTRYLETGDPAALLSLADRTGGGFTIEITSDQLHAASLEAIKGKPGSAAVVDSIPEGWLDYDALRGRGWNNHLVAAELWQVAVCTSAPRDAFFWHADPTDVAAAEARPDVKQRLAEIAERSRLFAEQQREAMREREREQKVRAAQRERDRALAAAHGYPTDHGPGVDAKELALAKTHGAVTLRGHTHMGSSVAGPIVVPHEPAGASPAVGDTITVWSRRNGALPKIVKTVTPLGAAGDLLWDQITVRAVATADGRPSEALVLNLLTTTLMKRAAKVGAVRVKSGKSEMVVAWQKAGRRTVAVGDLIGIGMPTGYPHYGKPQLATVTAIVRTLGEKAGVQWVEVEVGAAAGAEAGA